MIRTREDSFFKIRSAVPEFFPLLLLLLLASFFLRPLHLTGDLVKGISAVSTDFASIISTISGEEHEHASLDVVDQKQPKFRKKFQHLNDATSDFQPFQKRLEIRYHLPVSNPSGYEKPHFYSGQHAFLYRLTYF